MNLEVPYERLGVNNAVEYIPLKVAVNDINDHGGATESSTQRRDDNLKRNNNDDHLISNYNHVREQYDVHSNGNQQLDCTNVILITLISIFCVIVILYIVYSIYFFIILRDRDLQQKFF
ncbi:ac78 [Artaxa digramma nucleopolyhedrovirus]|uniref:Ac78 n=1 Tax=Artaxa digramma nucleopolyhedrovirus TaxID=3070910 RepID=A0AAE6R6F6_9ABAC|nr:ac78 [Euproctis digramma nucleopolyhedrovirus]QHB21733.1 ac78 [Artaxa digramma nucleopolyhedrovirus]